MICKSIRYLIHLNKSGTYDYFLKNYDKYIVTDYK